MPRRGSALSFSPCPRIARRGATRRRRAPGARSVPRPAIRGPSRLARRSRAVAGRSPHFRVIARATIADSPTVIDTPATCIGGASTSRRPRRASTAPSPVTTSATTPGLPRHSASADVSSVTTPATRPARRLRAIAHRSLWFKCDPARHLARSKCADAVALRALYCRSLLALPVPSVRASRLTSAPSPRSARRSAASSPPRALPTGWALTVSHHVICHALRRSRFYPHTPRTDGAEPKKR